MRADAGDLTDGDVVCPWLEGYTVVVVGDLRVGDGYIGALADVEAVGVLGVIV